MSLQRYKSNYHILQLPFCFFKGLIRSYDAIVKKTYDATPPLASPYSGNNVATGGEPIRMVGLNKSPNESLV